MGGGVWICLVCLPTGLSLHLQTRVPSGREVGEQVGANIREADQEVAAEVGQNGGKSEFQSSYGQTLTAGEMVLVNPAVAKVFYEVNRLSGTLIERDGLCKRRWEAKCPDGWALAGNSQCVAPAAYGGACKRVRSFAELSAVEKQKIAEECKSPWPCEDDCPEGRDYSELCPEGWSDNGGGFCEAPAEYNTTCATFYDFAEMDLKTKEELAQTCNFKWKCKAGCQQDFSNACPESWSEVPLSPGTCMAPATYAGVCSFSVNTTHMTMEQRAAFGAKCAVTWPCLSHGAAAAAGVEHKASIMLDGPGAANVQMASAMATKPIHAQAFKPGAGAIGKMFMLRRAL